MSFDKHDSQGSASPSPCLASWQHHGFMQTLVGHGSFSGSGSTKSEQRPLDDDELSRAFKDDFKEEINLMVAALEACALSRAEAQDAGDRLLASSTNGDSIIEPSRRIAKPGPPKRFHRRGVLWSSMTRRMLFVASRPILTSPSPATGTESEQHEPGN